MAAEMAPIPDANTLQRSPCSKTASFSSNNPTVGFVPLVYT